MSTVDGPKRDTVRIEGPAPRILLIQAPYYEDIVGGMRKGVERVVAEAGGVLEVVDVAGAFELPAALRIALDAMEHPEDPPSWDGFVLLGCVVKGETDHYDHICREACSGVMSVSVQSGAAIGFGLLTVHTLQQAIERSSDDGHNKGAEAAQAALLQVGLRRKWRMS